MSSRIVVFFAAVALTAQVSKRTVSVPMRDDVPLATDIYGADPGGKRPVLLSRTPYNKNGAEAIAKRYAAAGYVVVVQDERGRYASAGASKSHPGGDA